MFLWFYNSSMFKNWQPKPVDYVIFIGLVVNLAVIIFLLAHYFTK